MCRDVYKIFSWEGGRRLFLHTVLFLLSDVESTLVYTGPLDLVRIKRKSSFSSKSNNIQLITASWVTGGVMLKLGGGGG